MQLQRIVPKEKDSRSFDEVQADRRVKAGGGTGSGATAGGPDVAARLRAAKSGSRSMSPTKAAVPNMGGSAKKEKEKVVIPTSARPTSARPLPAPAVGARKIAPVKRARARSDSASSSGSYDTRDRDRGRASYGYGYGRDRGRSPTPTENNYSSVIQSIFRRGPPPPSRGREVYSDEDDFSDDMEAGLDDIEEEDRRASRIGRREDDIAEREEKERKERKERMKRERERERARGR